LIVVLTWKGKALFGQSIAHTCIAINQAFGRQLWRPGRGWRQQEASGFRAHWVSPMKKYSTDEGSKGGRTDLAVATKGIRDSGERIADALVIAQQKDPIFQDPRLVMLELTLATHMLEAAS